MALARCIRMAASRLSRASGVRLATSECEAVTNRAGLFSRPLALAWKELEEKGFMCVSRVFPHEVLRKLTHGSVEKATLSGRTGNIWRRRMRNETKINGGM